MGLLSGLFGGGSTTTTTSSTTNVDVQPVTNIDIPLDELAQATLEGATLEAQATADSTKALLELGQAELELEAQTKQAELVQSQQLYEKITTLLLLGGGIYLFTKLQKGK